MELYNIHQAHRSLIAEIEANEGELTPELESTLNGLEIDLNEKLASMAYVVKEYSDKALLVANEIKRLQGLEKSHKNNAEYFKQYIDTVMRETGISEVKQNNIRLSYHKSTAVEIFDLERIEERYMVVNWSPNKTLIKAAIEAGELVPGAEIVERQNLQIK